MDLKRYHESIEYYNKSLDIEPNYSFTWMNKGIALSRIGKNGEGIKCYNRALELDPSNSRAWLNKGINLLLLEGYEEAEDCFDKALEFDAKEALAWYYKGHICLSILLDYEQAIRNYDKALEFDPSLFNALDEKSKLLEHLGRYDESLLHINKALEQNCQDTGLLLRKCRLLIKKLAENIRSKN